MSLEGLIEKLQKLSAQARKGMTRHNYAVWTDTLRADLAGIADPEVRERALQLFGPLECSGFCLDRAPETREALMLPAIERLIAFLEMARARGP